MGILIVDDELEIRFLLEKFLNKAGYSELYFASSGKEASMLLGLQNSTVKEDESGDLDSTGDVISNLELIFLDIMMPEIDGIEVLKKIKETPQLKEIPVIMVTALTDVETLEKAFESGAIDYITKPVRKVELIARTNSAISLYREIKARIEREKELEKTLEILEETNKKLERLATIDELTQLPNRRLLDETLRSEWKRAKRKGEYLSLIILDIDYFKRYNDTYGHQKGDECLRIIAQKLNELMLRPGDFVARYGGEEFAVILPETDREGSFSVAERIRKGVESLKIPHQNSQVSDYVTVSLGTTTADFTRSTRSTEDMETLELDIEMDQKNFTEKGNLDLKLLEEMLETADTALYQAKNEGRNRVGYKDFLS